MKYSTYYDLTAFLFAVLIIADYAASYRAKNRRNDYFKTMAILDIIVIIFDVLIRALNGVHYAAVSARMSTLLSTLYYLAYALFFFFGCKYFETMVAMQGEKTKTGRNALIVLILQALLLCCNLFFGFYFHYDDADLIPGNLYWLCIGMNLFFVLDMCTCTLRHRECFSRESSAIQFLMIFLAAFSGAAQFLIHYGIIAGGYATTICLMTFLFTIERSENEKLMQAVTEYNDNLETLVKEKTRQLAEAQSSIINGMADIITGRESYCEGHTARTTAIVAIVIDKMKRDPQIRRTRDYYDCIIKAVPLHDIGEISISDEILDNCRNLSGEERRIYQAHTLAGAAAVRRIFEGNDDPQLLTVAENITRYHHENYDGSGYPSGLREEEIPLEARIVSMAESFDLYMSETEDKSKDDVAAALKMIWDNMNRKYDPTLVRFLFASREAISNLYEKKFSEENRKKAGL